MKITILIISIFFISGCSRGPADISDLGKDYFKDRVASAPGFSKGVAPTQREIAKQEIIDLGRRKIKEYDFGDMSSTTLTIKAWEALNTKDEKGILLYTEKCLELYEQDAKSEQAQLMDFAPQADISDYQILNDVGTCYFIRGEFYKYKKEWEKAKRAYQRLVDNFRFSQCWDPRGWHWKPAEIAEDEIRKINEGYYEQVKRQD